MENLILSFEPLFHRIDQFVLWKNRYASVIAFFISHGLFYIIAYAGLKPYCGITLILFLFHIFDCLKKKHLNEEEKNCSDLTQLILRIYRSMCNSYEKLNMLKTENHMKYSLILIIICSMFAYVGVKINGYYVSYIVMLSILILPAIIYHRLVPKLLKRLAPLLEQLDQSMEYKRRTLIDRKDLLVQVKTPGLNEEEEDEDLQKLKKQQISSNERLSIINEEENDESQSLLSKQTNPSESNFDMLSDSASMTDDEVNQFYATIADKINGKQRIRIKSSDKKMKEKSQPDNVKNASGEPDLTSFDFLNDYDEK